MNAIILPPKEEQQARYSIYRRKPDLQGKPTGKWDAYATRINRGACVTTMQLLLECNREDCFVTYTDGNLIALKFNRARDFHALERGLP